MVLHSILRSGCYTERGVVETSFISTGPESVRLLIPPSSTGQPRQSPIPSLESPMLGNFYKAVCYRADRMLICILTNACKLCRFLKKQGLDRFFGTECSTQILPVQKWTSPSIQQGRPLPRPDACFWPPRNFPENTHRICEVCHNTI